MNISLTSELESYIQEKVSSGLYTSASEVVRESLRMMHHADEMQQQSIAQLNHAIDIGMDQLNAGKKIPASETYNALKQKINNIAKGKK